MPKLRSEPGEPRVGYDVPLPNGCWKCIGCGKILSPRRNWNQCSDCDTRTPEDY
jgi:hypothetical protein